MKKLFTIMITLLLLLTGCNDGDKKSKYASYKGIDYINEIKNYVVREKNVNNTTNNEDFEKFLDKLFIDGLSSSYLYMHFSVVNYKNYGIEKPEVTLGHIEYSQLDQESIDECIAQLDELQSFDFSTLSYRQQYDYEAMEYSLYETLADLFYSKYEYLFKNDGGILSDLVTNFTDFTFYDHESVDDYMTLIADVPRYFDEALVYEKAQTEDGIKMTDYSIKNAQDYAKGFVSKVEDNELIESFNKRIDDLDFLTSEEKESYKANNAEIIKNSVIPAYQKVRDELEQYKGLANVEKMTLAKLNPELAEITFILSASNNGDVNAAMNAAKNKYREVFAAYSRSYPLYANAIESDDMNYAPFNLDAKEELLYITKLLTKRFPDLGDVDFTVDPLDPSTAPDSVLAYYFSAPIDNLNQNIIRTNPNTLKDDPIQTYTTLSHEGFPGHLYQHIYHLKNGAHNFRSVIGFSGYTEGYAVYAQSESLRMLFEDKPELAEIFVFDNNYYFMAYSYLDMGINYKGWNLDEFKKEMSNLGFSTASAKKMYDFFVDMPGVYETYGLGYVKMCELLDKAKNALGDKFDYIEYNGAILKNGPLPYNILEGAVDEYIASK